MKANQIELIIRVERIRLAELNLLRKPHLIRWGKNGWIALLEVMSFYHPIPFKETEIIKFMGIDHKLDKRIKAWKLNTLASQKKR